MTLRFALLGHPVGHSLSPALMQPALDELCPGARYEVTDVPPGELRDALLALAVRGYEGFNVTHPFKVSTVPLVRRLSSGARRCGAVNCIAVGEDGALTGYNTDVGGARYLLETMEPAPGSTLLLGAGGSARAVAVALEDLSLPPPVVTTRSPHTAAAFAQLFPAARVVPWYRVAEPAFTAGFDLVVNCTPVGMSPAANEAPLPGSFRTGQTVLDLIYMPRPTRFLREARDAGAVVRDGLPMLAVQAALTLAIWLDLPEAPVERFLGIAEDLLPAAW